MPCSLARRRNSSVRNFLIGCEIYPAHIFSPNTPPYPDSMMDFVYDFNGDGWPDYLKVSLSDAWLYINPKGESRHWDAYQVVKPLQAECVELSDIDGGGRPELIMDIWPNRTRETRNQAILQAGEVGYAKPDWSDVTRPWTFHSASGKGEWGNHAMGSG